MILIFLSSLVNFSVCHKEINLFTQGVMRLILLLLCLSPDLISLSSLTTDMSLARDQKSVMLFCYSVYLVYF